jgi:hypothetical protein
MGLALVEVVLAIEEECGVEIPDGATEGFKTPRDIVEFVVRQRSARGRVDRPKIERQILAVIAQMLEVPPASVTLDAKLPDLTGD